MFEVQVDRISCALLNMDTSAREKPQYVHSMHENADIKLLKHKPLKNTHSLAPSLPENVLIAYEPEASVETAEASSKENLVLYFNTTFDQLPKRDLIKMLPLWILQMKPERHQYGSYGSRPIPVWWPCNVPYKNPRDLDKLCKSRNHLSISLCCLCLFSANCILATHLLVQHRLSDEFKRQQSWTENLRRCVDSIPTSKSFKETMSKIFYRAHLHEDNIKAPLNSLNDAPRGGVVRQIPISNSIPSFASPGETIIDNGHETPGSATVTDCSDGPITQFYQWPQKKQRTMTGPVTIPQLQYSPEYNTTERFIDRNIYHNSWTDATGEHRTISEDHTPSAETAIPLFDDSARYPVQHSTASLDKLQEDTEYIPQARTTFLYGSGDSSDIEVPALQPQVGYSSTDNVITQDYHTLNEAYHHPSVTFGNEAVPNSEYGHDNFAFHNLLDYKPFRTSLVELSAGSGFGRAWTADGDGAIETMGWAPS
jgi:hypothetical protein